VFSIGSAPILYDEDPRSAEIELRESREMTVEDDSEEMARNECGCEKKTSYMLKLQ
jgi:hypothetical protein